MQYGNNEIRVGAPVQGNVVVTNVPADHHHHQHGVTVDHHHHQHGLTAGSQNLNQGLTHDQKAEHFEENDLFYSKERRNYVEWTRNLGIVAVILSIASLVLASIHANRYHPNFIILLVTSAVLFLLASIAIVVWSSRSAGSYKSHTDIFQPRSSDNLTKSIFILGLIFAGLSLFLLTNLYVQDEYSVDFARAAKSVTQTWNDRFGEETTLDSAINFFRIDFIVQSCIAGFLFFFFLLSSRAAFRSLKWDNQAMSYLVFLGGTLFLIFGLGIIYYASISFRYEDIPNLQTRFPLWNLRALFILGIVITVISFVGFLIDHQSWRIGFFVLSFVLLVTLVLLVNFTGYGYRHSRQIYNYYKAESDTTNYCHTNLLNVDETDIQAIGCPAKYLAATCSPTSQVGRWEKSDDNAPYCLNYACCGLLGQLYSESYLDLSNWGLLATLAGTIMSIACYYFWYVSWVDTSRDKRKDFFWLGIMGLSIVTFLIIFFAVDYNYIDEKPSGGKAAAIF